ncbi:MAG: 1,6-anhydro-N-acetylmuramyl-L-alanine amidase AmpD [Burkholderiales bacterium]
MSAWTAAQAPGSAPAELALPRTRVDRATQRLENVRYAPTPHCDERPDPADISLIVVHAISLPPGAFGGPHIERFFTGRLDAAAHPYFGSIKDLEVSAHLLIDRHGEITQFVTFDRRAWHAGASFFDGRERCNDFSIGIELEGSDEQPFAVVQYERLARCCRALLEAYPALTAARIVGHSDIAPGRKTDPGPHFDWDGFLARLEYPR